MLPFTLLPYGHSLAAWSIAMVFAYVLTLHLVGLRLGLAVPFGIGVALTFPGAYGIGNPVPVVALGIALAYRYRDSPIAAGAGIALATAPKASGLVLLIPFLLTRRLRAAGWAVFFTATLACVPLLLYSEAWSRYFGAGVRAIRTTTHRPDNASILNLADKTGISSTAALAILTLAAIVLAIALRDLFWPTAWFCGLFESFRLSWRCRSL
jgi:uncharacterized membrane protein